MPQLLDWFLANVPGFTKSRLPSLYSDLQQQKQANPDGFVANSTTWRTALTAAAAAAQLPGATKVCINTSNELLQALSSREYGQPSGLGLVLEAAVREGDFIPAADFKSRQQSIYTSTWIPSLGKVLAWSLQQTGLKGNDLYDRSGKLRPTKLVIVEVLEQLAEQIQKEHSTNADALSDHIQTRDSFRDLLKHTPVGSLTPEEEELLLLYLSRDKQFLSYNNDLVKYRSDTTHSTQEAITPEDITIASLQSTIESLTTSVSSLESRVLECDLKARHAISSKNRSSAVAALRAKKLAQQNLGTRTTMLRQLEEVYSKIEQARDQSQFIKIIEASKKTLKELNRQVGGLDRVERVMNEVRAETEVTKEIGQVLREPMGSGLATDEVEHEIDEEFERMEKEQGERDEAEEARKVRERLENIGNLPTTNSGMDSTEKEAERSEKEEKLDEEVRSASQKIDELAISS